MMLITGGAGFIGSNLAEYFVEKDEDVRILDNFSTGSMGNLKGISNKVEIIKGSIGNKEVVKKSLKDVDIVLHNAAFLGVSGVMKNPWKVFEENNHGNHIFFNEVLKSDIKKLIFASSSEVYSGTNAIPHKETQLLKLPNPYSTEKKMAELYCEILAKNYGVDTCSFRYFNVYGKNQTSPYGFVIYIFLKNALEGKPITIFGDGKQTRDFTYIVDVVNANVIALRKKTYGEVFNIGTGIETSINDLAKMVLKITNSKVNIVHTKPRKYESGRRVADISKAKKILKWSPKVDLNEGLKKTWGWVRNARTKR